MSSAVVVVLLQLHANTLASGVPTISHYHDSENCSGTPTRTVIYSGSGCINGNRVVCDPDDSRYIQDVLSYTPCSKVDFPSQLLVADKCNPGGSSSLLVTCAYPPPPPPQKYALNVFVRTGTPEGPTPCKEDGTPEGAASGSTCCLPSSKVETRTALEGGCDSLGKTNTMFTAFSKYNESHLSGGMGYRCDTCDSKEQGCIPPSGSAYGYADVITTTGTCFLGIQGLFFTLDENGFGERPESPAVTAAKAEHAAFKAEFDKDKGTMTAVEKKAAEEKLVELVQKVTDAGGSVDSSAQSGAVATAVVAVGLFATSLLLL